MKKFALAAIAAAAAVSFGTANAYTSGTFSNGVVVPNVISNGVGESTAVGLVSIPATDIHWTFFDQDSNHVKDGCISMTAHDYFPFVWSSYTGLGLDGARGYLVFAAAAAGSSCKTFVDDGGTLAAPPAGGWTNVFAAHAFQVSVSTSDVAYTPVIDGPLEIVATTNLATMDPNSLVAVSGAAQVGPAAADVADLFMRYFTADGAKTNIVVWSTGDQKKTHTVEVYNDAQAHYSANFKLGHTELDWFDPQSIPGWDPTYVDGFINWTVSQTSLGLGAAGYGSVFSYSVINAPAFGAIQSVLGFHN